jgi:hypothetical protein
MKRTGIRTSILGAAALAAFALGPVTVMADSSASDLPPAWHVHDGQTGLGPQHKGIGFFPTILGISTATYLEDPARCPNATDKAFLPSVGSSEAPLLRAGACFTSTATIQLRTLPLGVSGPEGWSALSGTDGGAWVTYYLVTAN